MISERLKAAMAAAHINQVELARACGVKPPSVNGWLSGKAKFLRGENLLAAARALGVSSDWLATGDGQMHLLSDDEVTSSYERPLRLVSPQDESDIPAAPMLTITFSESGAAHFAEAVAFVKGRPRASRTENLGGMTRHVATFYRTPGDADHALQLLAYLGKDNDIAFVHAGDRMIATQSALETLKCYAGASASGDIDGFCSAKFDDHPLPCSRLLQPAQSPDVFTDDEKFSRHIRAMAVRAECEWCPLFGSRSLQTD